MERLPTQGLEPLGWYAIRVLKNFDTPAEECLLRQETSGSRVPDALRVLRTRFRAAVLDVREM